MKIIICGGHLTPAISVIEELSKNDKVYYFGRKHAIEGDSATSLEFKTVSDLGIPFVEIKTGRAQRQFTKYTIPSLFKIPIGFTQAMSALIKIKPDIVVGFGGYVSIPVCFAAWLKGIPVIIHEQTLEAGGANKLLSKIAKKVCVSFESSMKYFPSGKTVLTGNPIRKGLFNPVKNISNDTKKPIIYITGGSLGSHVINKVVLASIDDLLSKYTIIHQVGSSQEFKDYEALLDVKEKLPNDLKERYILSKFFSVQELGEILKISDIIIGRAGINTVSELIVFNKPAILIPLPHSQRNEQFKNASLIKEIGLGEILEQKDLSPEKFIEKIDFVVNNLSKYTSAEPQKYFSKDSAKKIVKEIYATSKTGN